MLQLLGLCFTLATLLVFAISWLLWKRLPDNKKVWAVALIIGWSGAISMLPTVLGPF